MNELRPKLFDVMKSYTKKQLIKDIISGIIVAIIALPLSIALAIASGQHHWKCVWKTEFCFSFFPCSIYYHEPDTADDLTGIYHCCSCSD